MSSSGSTSQVWRLVNAPEESVTIDTQSCCRSGIFSGSPIDVFYEAVRHVLTLGEPAQLSSSPTLGRLLVMGIVASTENYFRSVLVELTRICPLAASRVADTQVPIGALDFYGSGKVLLGALEGVSFASVKEVKARTKTIAGFEIPARSSLAAALDNFDVVCHMRHAAVHSHGLLNRGNVAALGLDVSGEMQLVIELVALHQAAKACLSLVRAYNSSLYNHTLDLWISKPLLQGNWEDDRIHYKPLHSLFWSAQDNMGKANAYHAYRTMLPTLNRRLVQQPI